MSVTVTGRVERRDIGPGAWALVADDGEAYELQDPPAELCRTQTPVRVTGELRPEVMTVAAIGPVLAVRSFSPLAD
ncbi:MAG: hypothetical protein BRC58_07450 [Cyanobacteria bacterium QS_8_64_29]|nr:MAG: hypothetical protein BRC58_07450 [Cyanobacteria bacterium QS_8_64_29]